MFLFRSDPRSQQVNFSNLFDGYREKTARDFIIVIIIFQNVSRHKHITTVTLITHTHTHIHTHERGELSIFVALHSSIDQGNDRLCVLFLIVLLCQKSNTLHVLRASC